jgi:hypothetical protein
VLAPAQERTNAPGACPEEHEPLEGEADPGSRARSRWAESGMLALTGFADGPPVLPTVALADAADGALAALAALAPAAAFASLAGGSELLAERAACAGLSRRGRISAGGACRLLRARDAWLAVNLPRADDARSLAAWLEDDAFAGIEALDDAAWVALAGRLAAREAAACAERARWLGLAVAVAPPPRPGAAPWFRVAARGPATRPRGAGERPLVVDLSSLWAGPLAGRLLELAGARVVKAESSRRPDGARFGNARFFALLNGRKESVVFDFAELAGRAALAELVASADVVIEGSRPRALRQLGLDAETWLRARPGRVWLSLTGYGRDSDAIAFGDDAAAAAGLCWCVASGAPLFVGDAIADSLAGLHGALATQAFWRRGESALLDVSLAGVVAHAIEATGPADARASRMARPLPGRTLL